MNEEKQAQRLARWVDLALDRRGSPPDAPTDLDDDVKEAIAAIRPDRAPAPRLSAEDLLSSLESGPLVTPGAGGAAQVIPFPEGERAGGLPRRWWRSVGGAGGVGLLLAAAGVLYLFGIDAAVLEAPTPPDSTALPAAPAAAAEAPSQVAPPPQGLPDNALDAKSAGRQMPLQKPISRGGTADVPKLDGPMPVAQSGPAVRGGIAESEPLAARALPAEDLAGADANAAPDPGLAEMDASGLAGDSVAYEATKQAYGRDKRRSDRDDAPPAVAAAEPVAVPPPPARQSAQFGWAAGVDATSQAEFDAARGRAQNLATQGRNADAAATVSAVVHAPARAGQYHAALAVDYWLAAGDPDAAVAIALQGLALSSEETPERSALLARLARAEAAQPQLDRMELMDESDERR